MSLSPRGQSLSTILFSLHDKPERVSALLAAHKAVEPKDAAVLFGEVWTNSESLFDNRDALQTLIAFVHDTGTARYMMEAPERAQLAKIKKKADKKGRVTLFRGAAQHNIEGFSWTVNRDTATFFAKRNALDGKPLIVSADFCSDDLIAYMGGRSEYEIIVDISRPEAQEAIRKAEIEFLTEFTPSGAQLLTWKIQAFGDAMFDTDGQDTRLMATVMFAKARGTPLEDILAQWERSIAKLDEFPGLFPAKRAEFEKKIKDTTEFYAIETPTAWGSSVTSD